MIALFLATALECGVRLTGLSCPATTLAAAITSSDCPASDGSGYDLWQFSGNAGDTITIDMRSTSFDAYLVLLDPSDVPVALSVNVMRESVEPAETSSFSAIGTSDGSRSTR